MYIFLEEEIHEYAKKYGGNWFFNETRVLVWYLWKVICDESRPAGKQHTHFDSDRDGFSFHKQITDMGKKINEDGDKECLLLLELFEVWNEIDFSRNIKYVFQEHVQQLLN